MNANVKTALIWCGIAGATVGGAVFFGVAGAIAGFFLTVIYLPQWDKELTK